MTCQPQGFDFRSIQTLYNIGSVGGMTEGELLERFLARRDEGSEAAFAALVSLHGAMVWNVCRGVLSDPHAAEDAFQATFLILMRRAGSIRQRELVGPWLHGVARRVAVRARIAATRRRRREAEDQEMTTTPPPDPSRREQVEALHEEVDRLPEKYRAAVVLCHLEGRTHAEAARMLNCPVGTVSVRLSRARERLRARLTRRGVVLPAALAGAMLRPGTASAAMPPGLAPSTIKAAMHLAAGKAMTAGAVPAAVAELAKGEIKIMFLTRLTMAASGVLAAGIVTAGVGWLAAGEPPARGGPGVAPGVVAAPPPELRETVAQGLGPNFVAPPPPQARDEQEARLRARSMNKLRTLAVAMLNFVSRQNKEARLPSAAIRKDGKPLLSWRVALLPLLDQKTLYEKFHLDEPWDSPHNKPLLREIPEVYAPVVGKNEPEGSTYYQVFVGPGALFEGDEGTRTSSIRDGAHSTLMTVEAAEPVPWTKPEDLSYDKEKPLPKLGGQFEDGFHVFFADGSGLFLSKEIDPEILRALITRNGREVINVDKLRRP